MVGASALDERGKEGPHLGLDEQGVSQPTGHPFPSAVRVADIPDDLGKLLDMGLEEHFRGPRGQRGAAQFRKGCGQSGAGGVSGGAGWLSFPLKQHHGTTRTHASDLKPYLK